jgi:hypothetical protein
MTSKLVGCESVCWTCWFRMGLSSGLYLMDSIESRKHLPMLMTVNFSGITLFRGFSM